MNELFEGWKEEKITLYMEDPSSNTEEKTRPNPQRALTVNAHDRMRTASLINSGALSWPLNPRRNPVSNLECGYCRPVPAQCRDQV